MRAEEVCTSLYAQQLPTALLPYSCRGSVIEGTESLSPDSDTPHQSSCRTTATCRRSAKTRCRPPRARSQHLHARLDQSCTTARTTTIFNLSFEIPTMDAVQMFLVIFLALFFICGIIAPQLTCQQAKPISSEWRGLRQTEGKHMIGVPFLGDQQLLVWNTKC